MKPVTSDDPLAVFAKTPFTRLLGMQRDYSEGGKAQISLDPHADLGNVIGAVHGGVVVTLLDVVMASAAVSPWSRAVTTSGGRPVSASSANHSARSNGAGVPLPVPLALNACKTLTLS